MKKIKVFFKMSEAIQGWLKNFYYYFGLFVILVFGVAACASSNVHRAPVVEGWKQPAGKEGHYIVQKGDTLYSIAWAFTLDYRDLAAYNHLLPPYRLHPGQTLRMSAPALPLPARAATPMVKQAAHIKMPHPTFSSLPSTSLPLPPKTKQTTNSKKKTIVVLNKQTKAISKPIPNSPPLKGWLRPTQGKIVKGFSLASGGNKGIEIAGQKGQPIFAAAPGRVVYAGSGLRGYGNLIIIKHNDDFLSAYAYNKALLVKEGMSVKRGQKIALMGTNNAGKILLHFEIRRKGKPVNPMKFLS